MRHPMPGALSHTSLMWSKKRKVLAKNIPKCLLALMDSGNVFHGSCLGMAVAVGSSGRSTWRPGIFLGIFESNSKNFEIVEKQRGKTVKLIHF